MYSVRWMGELIQASGLKDQGYFERLLAERFPAIAAEIDEYERGLLHPEMAVLARVTCRAIELGDSHQLQAHLSFVDELFSDAASDLENAVNVSYLENVFLWSEDPRYVSARAMLSRRLQIALTELEDHWEKLTESWKAHQASKMERSRS
jgi:hypothetical protein